MPLGVIAFAGGIWLLRRGTREETSLDLPGTGLLMASLFALMAGITQFGEPGVPGWLTATLLSASIGLMVVFIWREKRCASPLIDMVILTKGPFLASNIYNFMYGACILGIMSLVPLFGVTVYGLSTFQSGLILTPRSIGMILMSTITAMSLPRWGYRRPIIIGTAIMLLTLALLGLEFRNVNIGGLHLGAMAILFILLGLFGLGIGICAPAANNACIELMPDRISTIIGLRGMFRQFGGAISIAIATLLLHGMKDMATGFRIVFFGALALMLLSIPCIFIMPSGCKTPEAK